MSRLLKDLNHVLTFKDPIVTVAWRNFNHTPSNIKKWLENIKLPQMRFFLKKQLKNFSCTSWSLFWVKLMKKPESWLKWKGHRHHTIFVPKWTNCSEYNKISFRKTINVISMSLLVPFIVQNCKTILTADPELWDRMWHSGS